MLDLVFDEVCRVEPSMVDLVGKVSPKFFELVERIADETVVIDD